MPENTYAHKKKEDEYVLIATYTEEFPNTIIRVWEPILTEEEYGRRHKSLEEAFIKFMIRWFEIQEDEKEKSHLQAAT